MDIAEPVSAAYLSHNNLAQKLNQQHYERPAGKGRESPARFDRSRTHGGGGKSNSKRHRPWNNRQGDEHSSPEDEPIAKRQNFQRQVASSTGKPNRYFQNGV